MLQSGAIAMQCLPDLGPQGFSKGSSTVAAGKNSIAPSTRC